MSAGGLTNRSTVNVSVVFNETVPFSLSSFTIAGGSAVIYGPQTGSSFIVGVTASVSGVISLTMAANQTDLAGNLLSPSGKSFSWTYGEYPDRSQRFNSPELPSLLID